MRRRGGATPTAVGEERRALWTVRATARTPRVAWLVAWAALAAAGLKSAVAPQSPAMVQPTARAVSDTATQAFAEAFARAYLTWDARAPEAHERRVARFVGRDVEPGAGLVVPPTGSQDVTWTAVVAERPVATQRRLVTVAAETSRGPVHLAVPVARDTRGALFVSSVPAVVGGPPRSTAGAGAAEVEVDERELRALAARVVRNYLGGERDDLAADLHPRAVVSLPDARLAVRSADAVTWVVRPRRVAVQVTAEALGGLRLSLRYELGVLRMGGRWVVRTVHSNPVAQEGDQP